MAELEVYADVGADSCCILFTFDPPGYLAHGRSLDDAVEKASFASRELRDFLQRCGRVSLLKQIWQEDENLQINVVEIFRNRGKVADGYTRATFLRDYDPVTPSENLEFVDLMECMRRELIEFKMKPDSKAMQFRSSIGDMTINDHLMHIASCDRWYLSRFWEDLPGLPRSHDVWHKLHLNRELAIRMLSNLNSQDSERSRKVNGEMWTARKLFRRFLYHERFHINCIRNCYELFRETTLRE